MQQVLEVGPGTGVLTEQLLTLNIKQLSLVEIDRESVDYLHKHYDQVANLRIWERDFLKCDLVEIAGERFDVIGNFPYNISSQIFFKVLEYKQNVPLVVGMIQKEVAERICSNEGNKVYGILSVLLGAFYERQMLFKVPPGVFNPPPKVDSAVIRLVRKSNITLPCNEQLFFKVVKQGFQNRRKTLRNALKKSFLHDKMLTHPFLDKRAEQLSIDDFIHLTKLLE